MSPTKSVRWLVLAIVSVSACLTVLYASEDSQSVFVKTFGDAMEWKSRWIAGRNAVNCGNVPVRGDPEAATDCALRAFAAHDPFRVRYGLQTMDTVMAAGVISSANGQLYEIVFSGGTPTGRTDLFRQRLIVSACQAQALLKRTANGRVTCDPATPIISSWLSAP
jgi:hypothetical protein